MYFNFMSDDIQDKQPADPDLLDTFLNDQEKVLRKNSRFINTEFFKEKRTLKFVTVNEGINQQGNQVYIFTFIDPETGIQKTFSKGKSLPCLMFIRDVVKIAKDKDGMVTIHKTGEGTKSRYFVE